jgi:putative ABC transport system substrate-binding protein
MTTRRSFISLLGGAAAAWPFVARAQQGERVPRVGVLLNGSAVAPSDLDIVRELARIGYIEGRNIIYEVRGAAGDLSRFPQLARELVASKPNVIVGTATPAADALFGATRNIPIVMTLVGDPIALGLTASMSRPTHNVTGFTISSLSLAAKRLELLHGIVPAVHTVGYLWVPESRLSTLFESHVRKAAEMLGIKLVSLPLTSEADIASTFVRAHEEAVTAVLVETNPLTLRASGAIVAECLVRNLPGIHSWPIEVRNGALVSYGPAAIENSAGTANYIVRILKGTKIAELPFEEPTQIKLVVNLRTARSIGIVFPPSLLARADEVIE